MRATDGKCMDVSKCVKPMGFVNSHENGAGQNWPDELKLLVGALVDLAVRVTSTIPRALVLNEILTPEELAARLKVPSSTIEELARKGKLPGAFRVGKHWRFDLDLLRSTLPTSDGDGA